jgi:NitT/TauT family transport system substrate-binding protein
MIYERSVMKIAIPDLISNSYFPALAAVELGCFAEEGLDVEIELIFPPDRAYAALADGTVDLVAASAHAAVSAFPDWKGVRLLCAQSRGMYWFLVMHQDFDIARGDIAALKGRRIGAAPWVELGLRGILDAAGIDPKTAGIEIGPVPKASGVGPNFGVSAFKALQSRQIDGFWANGMAAELAVRHGMGTVVLDTRRGDGPIGCFGYTFASIATSEAALAARPALGTAVKRAIGRAHDLLKNDIGQAEKIGSRLFPAEEASLIGSLIARDLPWYDTDIKAGDFAAMNDFLRRMGRLDSAPIFEDVVFLAESAG